MKKLLMISLGLATVSQNLVFAETISVRATSLNISQISLDTSAPCVDNPSAGAFQATATLHVKINGISLSYNASDFFVANQTDIYLCNEAKKSASRKLSKAMKDLTEAQSGDIMNDLDALGLNRRICYKSVLDVYFDDQAKLISQLEKKHIAARCP